MLADREVRIMKLRHLKARLSEAEYQALVECADAAGLTISEYARTVLARDRERMDVEAVLADIRAQLASAAAASAAAAVTTPAALPIPDPLLVEVIWLLRELAAERNAQVIGRVTSKLDSAYGRQRTKV
jgi:ribosomal protein L12E/L44/L45/RPP1/RPP2